MNRRFTNVVGSIMLTGSILLSVGAASSAQAQDWRWERQRRYEEQRRREEIIRQRQIERQRRNGYYGVDRNRNGVDDRYEYTNNGYYGNNNPDFQRGYRDGLQRGREDAQTNRAMTPNNSSHYRDGNATYRAGFERGFYQSYRQYSGRR